MDTTKFKLTTDGIEISGSEEFVKNQLELFKEMIEKSYDKILAREPEPKINSNDNPLPKIVKTSPTDETNNLLVDTEFTEVKNNFVEYENVIAIEGTQIQIIADIPGNTLAKRMINVVLIYLWAKLQIGIDTSSYSEIREVCQHHGELDGSNFAKYMESHKRFFLLLGEGKNKNVKLIRPGIKEAERLVNELNNQ